MRWMKSSEGTKSFFDTPVAFASNNNEHARHQVGMGVEVGSADLLLRTRRGDITYFFYLELKKLKKNGGKLSPDQIKWNEDFDTHYASSNCQRDVAYGLQEAKDKIIEWVSSLPLA